MNNPMPDLDELLATARAAQPDISRLEYAFETRLLARLAEERSASLLSWAWRLCPYFALLALAAAAWSSSPLASPETVWNETGLTGEDHALVTYMTGDSTNE